MTLDSALERVSAMLGLTLDWMDIRDFLPPHAEAPLRKSALASSFVAALELARLGRAEIAQDGAFAPLRIRRVKQGAGA
jgi:segregation and condensation protein A